MLRKYLSILLSVTIFFQNSTLLASTSNEKKTLSDYKKSIYKAFSPVKKIKKPEEKRRYLEKILDKINQKLAHVNVSTLPKEQLKNFSKMKNLFIIWRDYLPKVKDTDLDDFAETMIQETEQAFLAGVIIIAIILAAVVIALFATSYLKGPILLRTRHHVRRGVFFHRAKVTRPRYHAHAYVGIGFHGRRF